MVFVVLVLVLVVLVFAAVAVALTGVNKAIAALGGLFGVASEIVALGDLRASAAGVVRLGRLASPADPSGSSPSTIGVASRPLSSRSGWAWNAASTPTMSQRCSRPAIRSAIIVMARSGTNRVNQSMTRASLPTTTR